MKILCAELRPSPISHVVCRRHLHFRSKLLSTPPFQLSVMRSSTVKHKAALRKAKAKGSTASQLKPRGSGSLKRTPLFELEHLQMSDELFMVDSIVAERQVNRDGIKFPEFFIKWLGYADKFNTWEPMSNLAGLESEIAQYRKDKAAALDLERVRKEAELAKKEEAAGNEAADQANSCEEHDPDADTFRPAKRGRRTAACWNYFSEKVDKDGHILGFRVPSLLLCTDSLFFSLSVFSRCIF